MDLTFVSLFSTFFSCFYLTNQQYNTSIVRNIRHGARIEARAKAGQTEIETRRNVSRSLGKFFFIDIFFYSTDFLLLDYMYRQDRPSPPPHTHHGKAGTSEGQGKGRSGREDGQAQTTRLVWANSECLYIYIFLLLCY